MVKKTYLICVLIVLTFQQERQTPNQYTKVKKVKSLSCVRLFATPWTVVPQAPLSMGFSGKNTRVGCHFLLQGIFPTQGLNLGLQHCRQIIYYLSHQGSQIST